MKYLIHLANLMKMKTRLNTIGIPALIGMLSLHGCTGGTGEGNPEFGVLSISLSARAGLPVAKAAAGWESRTLAMAAATDTLRLLDAAHTPYAIYHIYAHIDQVEIERPKGGACRSSDSVVCTDSTVLVSGSRYVDLLENPNPLILKNFQLPLGVYNRMKVQFSQLADDGTGEIPPAYLPLVGHSILMQGTFAYRGVPNRALRIYLDIHHAFGFENVAGLAVNTGLPNNWAGIFLAGSWLKELEITKCLDENHIALEPDGSLIIDNRTTCNDLEQTLIENVRKSTSFEIEEEDDDELEH